MRTNSTVALGALALGVVLAAPAFGQGAQTVACTHFQQSCSDNVYAVTQPAATPAGPLYNLAPQVTHHDMQKTGTAASMQKLGQRERGYGPLYNSVPQPNAVQPCIHVQTSCM
jgi:hypothetical protein